MRVFAVTIIVLLGGCTQTWDITKTHPYAKSLLTTCTTEWPIYLYKGRWERTYSTFTETMKGYIGNRLVHESVPNLSLPPGATLVATRLTYELSISTGYAIWVYGVARSPGREDLPIRNIVEMVAVNSEKWRKSHPVRQPPRLPEYLRRVKESTPDWCVAPNKSLERTREE